MGLDENKDPMRPKADRVDEPIETPVQPSDEPEAKTAQSPRGWAPAAHSRRTILMIVAIAVLGICAILYSWNLPPFDRSVQTTDNAFVRGRTTQISPQVNGYIVDVPVQDFQVVRAGQILATIDQRIYRQRVEQAEATLASQQAALDNAAQTLRSRQATVGSQDAAIESARAQLARARADMSRVDELVGEGSVSLRERDQTRATLRAAEASLRQAEAARVIAREDVTAVGVNRGALEAGVANARAALRLAKIDLANTVIRAPADGQLGEVGVRLGAYVTAGTQLTFIVPRSLWVTANYKEAQTARMRIGQPVTFTVDALGGERLKGHIQSLAPATGSEFAVLRADNATGNFVKVAQRISVRISVDPNQELANRLRPGMSVETRIDTEQ